MIIFIKLISDHLIAYMYLIESTMLGLHLLMCWVYECLTNCQKIFECRMSSIFRIMLKDFSIVSALFVIICFCSLQLKKNVNNNVFILCYYLYFVVCCGQVDIKYIQKNLERFFNSILFLLHL